VLVGLGCFNEVGSYGGGGRGGKEEKEKKKNYVIFSPLERSYKSNHHPKAHWVP